MELIGGTGPSPGANSGMSQKQLQELQAAQQAEMMQQQRKIKEMMDNASAVICNICGSPFFKKSVILNKVSHLIAGGTKPTVFPVEIYTCEECGTPSKELGIPPSLIKLFKEQSDGKEE